MICFIHAVSVMVLGYEVYIFSARFLEKLSPFLCVEKFSLELCREVFVSCVLGISFFVEIFDRMSVGAV